MEGRSSGSSYTPDFESASTRSSQHFSASPVSSTSFRRQLANAVPSYMSYQNGAASKSEPTRLSESTVPSAPPVLDASRVGSLIIIIAGEPPACLLSHVDTLLKERVYTSVSIIGDALYESSLKQLKMDIYATIGRLRLEVAVYLCLRNDWAEDTVDNAVREAVDRHSPLQAVLGVPLYPSQSRSAAGVLDCTQDDIGSAWYSSLGFLHTVAKSTLPRLEKESTRQSLFLVVDESPQSVIGSVTQSACYTLMEKLNQAYGSRHLIIDRADKVLVSSDNPTGIAENGSEGVMQRRDRFANTDTFNPGESPTKLWNMWALQDDIVGVKS